MFVRTAVDDAVGLITLNRPEKANAYHDLLLDALEAGLDQLEQDPAVRVIVVTGEGRSFCAGADLTELRARDHREALELRSCRLFNRLARSPRVSIAAVNGPAIAGGFELSLACDLRLACPEAVFGLPEVGLGILPAAGGLLRLSRLIGGSRARAVILGGTRLTAAEAVASGLVTECVARDQLLERALEWAGRIARQNPLAMRLAKQVLELDPAGEAGERMTLVSQALLYELAHRPGKV